MAKAGRGSDQFMVRMPDGMRQQIANEAEKAGRSMNAQIVYYLERSLRDDANVFRMERDVSKLPEEKQEQVVQLIAQVAVLLSKEIDGQSNDGLVSE
jgi:hypothetical protein